MPVAKVTHAPQPCPQLATQMCGCRPLHACSPAVVQCSYLWALCHECQEMNVPRVRSSASDGWEQRHKFFIFSADGWGQEWLWYSPDTPPNLPGTNCSWRQPSSKYTIICLLRLFCLTSPSPVLPRIIQRYLYSELYCRCLPEESLYLRINA